MITNETWVETQITLFYIGLVVLAFLVIYRVTSAVSSHISEKRTKKIMDKFEE